MKKYNPSKIEKKWQNYWDDNKTFLSKIDKTLKKLLYKQKFSFGLGGGVIMVPLQVILLGENIKAAIQTSLGVIVITAIFACGSHAMSGNVLLAEGICLGIGGLFGVQLSTRFLPKLPENMVIFLFRGFMGLLAGYMFVKAWHSYLAT